MLGLHSRHCCQYMLCVLCRLPCSIQHSWLPAQEHLQQVTNLRCA